MTVRIALGAGTGDMVALVVRRALPIGLIDAREATLVASFRFLTGIIPVHRTRTVVLARY